MPRLTAFLATAFVLLAPAVSASAQPEQDRRELMTLYFASIAADRCDFPLTEEEADKLVRGASDLQKKLKLTDDAADVLYEEVETQFEKRFPTPASRKVKARNPMRRCSRAFARTDSEAAPLISGLPEINS